MNTLATIKIWDKRVGVILWDETKNVGSFEFDKSFVALNLDISPVQVPVASAKNGRRVFSFPFLNFETFKGLPGFLADSLPDKFGNQMIDAWLAQQGRDLQSFNSVDRLCYIGKRGMGALEFEPESQQKLPLSTKLEIQELVKFASSILDDRDHFHTNFNEENGYSDILQVGSSAGGARAKAIIAYNKTTGEVRSGQIDGLEGFDYWLIKFDGVTNRQLGDPKGYGNIEFAYHLMAKAAGIKMTECELKKEHSRAHFMTKRFDRVAGEKIHMQTLCGLAHFDYNVPGAYSYEQTFQVIRELRLPYRDSEQLFKRMVFNVMARNQDDHTKNISFLMDKSGTWSLSPAYDVTFAYNPTNFWLKTHQMSINGKRDNDTITIEDILTIAKNNSIKKPKQLVEEVRNAVLNWNNYAIASEIEPNQASEIQNLFNLFL